MISKLNKKRKQSVARFYNIAVLQKHLS